MTATSTIPPNVVLLMTDQHRAGFTAGEGFALGTMPFLDSVAGQGARFAVHTRRRCCASRRGAAC